MKARFTWDYELNAFRQVDRLVARSSDLSPLLAAFETGNDGQKGKLNSIVENMIKSSRSKAMNLLARVKEGNEEEFFVMLEENGVNEQALENLRVWI